MRPYPRTQPQYWPASAKRLRVSAPVDAASLARLPKRRLTPQQFIGSSYDAQREELIWRGEMTMKDGSRHTNPPYAYRLDKTWRSASSTAPEDWAEFAYAFLHPPYGLGGTAQELNALFKEMLQALLAGSPRA